MQNVENAQNVANPQNLPNGVQLPQNLDKESYVQYLLQFIKQQTDEMNKMQQHISTLEKAVGSKKLLEEDFHSFISRIEFGSHVSEEQRTLCLNKLFQLETQKLCTELKAAKQRRAEARSRNLALETEVIEITDHISAMKDALEAEKHKNYLESVTYNKNLAAKLARNNGKGSPGNNQRNHSGTTKGRGYGDNGRPQSPQRAMDYPPENIIIQTLIRTQIEFYFSDYNLKRDKRLLDQLCSDRIGFLKINSVMNLTRVRQLLSHRNQVINSLKSSKFLTLTPDREWVGRLNFVRPQEKQFPFRRTVFVFGLPMDCDEKYVNGMLSPFGKLSAVTFDHGPDTLDRLVAEAMFEETRVYRYRDLTTRMAYHYKQEIMVGGSPEYNCTKCGKTKQCDEGFYETNSYQTLICLQCTAASAESNLEKAKAAEKSKSASTRMIEKMCGRAPRDTKQTKTCLAVFTSQRQASKCVYVRSRIAYEGCFATHYHHYSKCKKEIALSMQHELKPIPPRPRVLPVELKRTEVPKHSKASGIVPHLKPPTLHSKLSGDEKSGDHGTFEDPCTLQMNSADWESAGSRDGNISVTPVALSVSEEENGGNNAIGSGVSGGAGNESRTRSSTQKSSVKLPKPIMSMIRTVPVFRSGSNESLKASDGDDAESKGDSNGSKDSVADLGTLSAPKLNKKNDGSMTAPVKGGTGDFYLTKAAYNRMHSNGRDARDGHHDDCKQNK